MEIVFVGIRLCDRLNYALCSGMRSLAPSGTIRWPRQQPYAPHAYLPFRRVCWRHAVKARLSVSKHSAEPSQLQFSRRCRTRQRRACLTGCLCHRSAAWLQPRFRLASHARGRRAATMAASLAERTPQDVQFWMPGILIGAASKPVPNGGSARTGVDSTVTERSDMAWRHPPGMRA